MRLKDKVAVVTGSSRGIGRAVAIELAREGANVVVNYTKNAEAAEEVAKIIKDTGREALIVQADVSKPQDVDKLKEEAIKKFGHVDILVNNAGINKDMRFAKMDYDSWKLVISTHLDGAFLCTKAFIDAMAEKGWGRVISISSIVGQKGNFGQANYAAAKAGLIGFTKTLAIEYAKKSVTVNAICPGFIDTDMVRGVPEDVMKDKILPLIPLGRIGKAEEIGKAVAYLAADDGAWITGSVISINGGQLM